MAFITVNDIAESGYGDLFLRSTSVTPQLISRRAEQILPNGKGYNVQFKIPMQPTVRERTDQTADVTSESVSEGAVNLSMSKNFYAALTVTNEQHLFSLENAMEQIVAPMITSINGQIETFFAQQITKGFTPFVSGTQGTNPSTLAHLSAAEKMIFDNKGQMNGLVGLFNSTAYGSLTQINQNISQDIQGLNGAGAIRENRINPLAGIQIFRSHGCASNLDRGAIAGTVLVKAAQTAGATSLTVDGLTNATGVMKRGTRFVLTTGDTTVYTVTADATAVASTVIIPIYPALQVTTTDNDPVVFQAAVTSCPIFAPSAVVGGVIPGAQLPNSVIINAGSMNLQLIDIPPGLSLQRTWVLQAYAGCEVLEKKMGAICQG